MKNNDPICKSCKEPFVRYNTIQRLCVKCAIEQVRKGKQKAAKRELAAGRARLKTKSDWLKEAQGACNAYIRERDKNRGCISCDKPASWGGQWHASHYRPAGNCSPLRFHELNIWKGCSECNNFKSGNLTEYRITLVNEIGAENVNWLESQNRAYSWDIDDIKDITSYFKEKLKTLKQQR